MMVQETGTSISTSFCSCKYSLPCGYCELKKQDCNWWQTMTVPCSPNITPTTPLNPIVYEVTCSAERSEDEAD